ncbi:cystathionine gamma-synthase [Thalassotalea sp. HSM 43]|uniref:cystathionine gamma-synthase n=1 Tax=Thalassotalea sp. HSM 43 TaxID=2552945 RepID=UPI0010814603|nr:cystathionine gamma-synthase [Thalassotalea sp. HSM 43]QBY04667.1 cystathionine gamma-synthase [Thalassotalea sp. HSM 43]
MKLDKLATIAVQAGINSDQHHGAVVPAMHLSSTYSLKGFNEKRQYDYSRTGNPTRQTLAEVIAHLEGGSKGIITSTGMSAIHLICQLLSAGDRLLIPHDCYGGSYRLFVHLAKRGQFELDVVDQTDSQALEDALAKKPKLVLVETPSNPLLRLVDIKKVCDAAKQVGALVAVDNTFLSPLLQRPLELGADIVIHSTTKFINGHSDIVGGAVVTKDPQLGDDLAWWANCIGITGSAFDAYLTLRGIKTLPVRLRAHQQNTQAVVALLTEHQAVEAVYYPGLSTHPGHEIAKAQQAGFGSMLSFDIKGDENQVRNFFAALQLFTLAQSLGGVESLAAHPSTMTHAGMDLAAQKAAGISQTLIRLSIGIEDADDIVADLQQALDAAFAAPSDKAG